MDWLLDGCDRGQGSYCFLNHSKWHILIGICILVFIPTAKWINPLPLLLILWMVFTPLESILLWFFKCLSADANNCDDLLRWLRDDLGDHLQAVSKNEEEQGHSSINMVENIIHHHSMKFWRLLFTINMEGGITSLAIIIIQTHFLELLDQEQSGLDILQFLRLLSSDWWER